MLFSNLNIEVVPAGTELTDIDTGETFLVTDHMAVASKNRVYLTQATYDAIKELPDIQVLPV